MGTHCVEKDAIDHFPVFYKYHIVHSPILISTTSLPFIKLQYTINKKVVLTSTIRPYFLLIITETCANT